MQSLGHSSQGLQDPEGQKAVQQVDIEPEEKEKVIQQVNLRNFIFYKRKLLNGAIAEKRTVCR